MSRMRLVAGAFALLSGVLPAAIAGGATPVAAEPSSCIQPGGCWSVMPSQPAGTGQTEITGVSCPSTTLCMAVGGYDTTSGAPVPLEQLWSGGQWSTADAGLTTAQVTLLEVSCPTTDFCAAVGAQSGGNGFGAEKWNGKRWTPMDTTALTSILALNIYSISCSSATFCVAVGGQGVSPTDFNDLAYLEWNGNQWLSMPGGYQDGLGGNEFLYGVSCVSSSFCVAVGDDEPAGTYYHLEWNGSAWSPMPPPPDQTLVSEVSCTSASFCMSLGDVAGGTAPETEMWDGITWSNVPVATGTGDSNEYVLSCSSSTRCVAVAGYPSSNQTYGAMTWNGATWVTTPISGPGSFGRMRGVSCPSTTFCVAGGKYGSGNTTAPLAEQWTT